MMLSNFRVVRLDSCNLTFEEYRAVESTRNGVTTSSVKWVRVGGYYGNMNQCLDGLKNHIINTYVDIDDYREVLNKISELNDAIVSCKIKVQIPDDDL